MRAGAGIRETSDQQVRPVAIGRQVVVLDENVIPNDRRLRSLRHPRKGRSINLVFDFHAISEGIEDEIVFDDPGDEGAAAVRVAEIDPGPGTNDRIAPDDPIPGRGFGRDPVALLAGAGAEIRFPSSTM